MAPAPQPRSPDSYPWSPFPPKRARPRPGPHINPKPASFQVHKKSEHDNALQAPANEAHNLLSPEAPNLSSPAGAGAGEAESAAEPAKAPAAHDPSVEGKARDLASPRGGAAAGVPIARYRNLTRNRNPPGMSLRALVSYLIQEQEVFF